MKKNAPSESDGAYLAAALPNEQQGKKSKATQDIKMVLDARGPRPFTGPTGG